VLWIDWDFPSSQVAFASLTTLAAWLRYMSSWQRDYSICLASSVSLGIATAINLSSFTAVSARCFPTNLQQTATAIGVQCNNLGFGLAALAIPFGIVATELGDIEMQFHRFLLSEAIICSVIFCFQMWVYLYIQASLRKAAPHILEQAQADTKAAAETDTETSVLNPAHAGTLTPSRHNRRRRGSEDVEAEEEEVFTPSKKLDVKCENLYNFISWALLGEMLPLAGFMALGFYFVGITDNVFIKLGYSAKQAAWANFSFVVGGIFAGLCFGSVPFEHYHFLQKCCMISGSVLGATVVAITIWMPQDPKHPLPDDSSAMYSALMVVIPLLGGAVLGAGGVALEMLGFKSRPYNPVYTCGITNMLATAAVFGLTAVDSEDFACLCLFTVFVSAVYVGCSVDPLA
jgi:hypothetical protein